MNANEQTVLKQNSQSVPLETSNPALPVFQTMMTILLTKLEQIDQKAIKKLRQSILAQLSLRLTSLQERQRLNAWIMGSAERLEVNIKVTDMRNCIHHAYRYACDMFGPSEADELLENALAQTECMNITSAFSPRQLF